MLKHFKNWILGRVPFSYAWDYILGNYRYWCSRHCKWIIRKYILNQVQIRYNSIDNKCKMNMSCKECGCDIPALLYCNRACEGGCYPKMLNKKYFEKLRIDSFSVFSDNKPVELYNKIGYKIIQDYNNKIELKFEKI